MRKIIGKLTVSTEFCTTSRSGTLPLGYLRLGYSVKQFGTDFLGNMTSIRTFKRMLSHRKNTQLLIRTNSCGSYLKICENKTKWQAKLSTHCLYLAIKLNPKIFSHKQRICTTEYFQNPVSLRVWSSCVMILIRGKQCVLSRFVGTVMYIIPIIQIMLEGTWNFFPLFN